MSDNVVSIFKDNKAVVSQTPRKSKLGEALVGSGLTTRRIQTNTNGTFKRIVNGDQIGDAVRGYIDVIVVGALPEISRVYYKEKYDPKKEATLPNCWSNLGDKPDPSASDPQSTACISCPQNIKGSSDTGGRACRFQRRISVLLADDLSGEVYQFNIPAKSLFGKGNGNVHPFENYIKFLKHNNEAADTVVTNISYNLNADSMEFQFSPVRSLSDDEYELVLAAQDKPETSMYTKLTVAQADNVTKPPQQVDGLELLGLKIIEAKAAVVEGPKVRSKKAADPAAEKKALADIVKEWE